MSTLTAPERETIINADDDSDIRSHLDSPAHRHHVPAKEA